MSKANEIEPLVDNYLRNSCSLEEYEKVIEILKNPEYNDVLHFLLSRKWSEDETNTDELSEEDKKDIRQSLSNIHHEINLYEQEWEFKSSYKKISRILINIAATLYLTPINWRNSEKRFDCFC